jgi:hypothetical protein
MTEPIGGPLTLRHWSKGRGGDFWGPGDYDVMSGSKVVGRIFRSATAPQDQPWMWTITGAIVTPAVRNHSFAAMRDDAKADFAAHWRKWLALRHSHR